MAIALYGFGDLAMRVMLTLISNWLLRLGIQESYIAGIAIAVISRLGKDIYFLNTRFNLQKLRCYTIRSKLKLFLFHNNYTITQCNEKQITYKCYYVTQ